MKTTPYISKKFRWLLLIAVVVFTGIQFIQPTLSNPNTTHPIQAPEEVKKILERSCYDCHSNETKLGWLNRVAPVSWLVSKDIQTARSRFNFSTWDTLSKADQQSLVWEMVNMIQDGKMPLPSYAATHPSSRLSPKEIDVLKNYARSLSPPLFHDSAIIEKADAEYGRFMEKSSTLEKLPETINGIKYIKDFRNWQVIGTTNRFDNHSIRVLYGNEIAVAAIRRNRIKPWPEGSTIVKVVWNSIEEENGDILPGSLNSVQIMTKDNARFPDTEGWGFAKFNGVNLKPYGQTILFNTTCFNCHKAASENGYVFNIPLMNKDLLNLKWK